MSETYKAINTNTLTPVAHTLIVTRFGLIDDEWYDRVYSIKRKQAVLRTLHRLKQGIVVILHQVPILASKALTAALQHPALHEA